MADIMSKKSFVEKNISMRAQSPLHLTEGQKACLRLVVQLHTSKEIARTLGISPFTVDQRLDAARRKLNAGSRIDAAKIFDAMERNDIYEPFVYEASGLEPIKLTVSQDLLLDRVRQWFAKITSFIAVPPIGGERHELSNKEILVFALNLAFFSTVILALVVVVLTGVFRLFQ
ncbi:MAG: helix-turn-helix transcriptional regulator [Sphingorhabdus sp.]|jgi:DNA-binding CsgD family transcriptional regulator|uniref:response regulator transcription factor n=1 Tax=Sphingorhabdus sp. TaxID=1902408 RepID=UPI0025E2F553|nr:helix-turn-helix transcriptional regulator [Sphingorhabdus sp.]MCO4090704.1 helix-turn-helix transcriptional regulator [Sphingorhabdus sp.]